MRVPRRTIIIGPPPTPNGDLHLGHMAGPYLAGDVYARYLRASGHEVLYATGTDDSQTYVVATASRLGTSPRELCATSTAAIARSLAVLGISVDGFAPFDDGYRQTVLEFVTRLYAAGVFRERRVRLPYARRAGTYLVEGLVAGDCPICLADSRGGLCETCGHPNNFDELINPRSTMDPTDPVSFREETILVLPLEEYRDRLTAYHQRQAGRWRPHIVGLVRELLARPLPDFPITYPLAWGVPAPFAPTPGQVINAWAEGMAASMYCTWWAARRGGERAGSFDAHWRAGRRAGRPIACEPNPHGSPGAQPDEPDPRLVYFLGFDNAYFWGMTHLALLMAHGDRYILPDTIVCNEFYELENEKFSTSKGHVVWSADLVAEVPRDLVRFHLALTSPEHQRTTFSRAALERVARTRLVEPWNALAEVLAKRTADAGASSCDVSAQARTRAATMVERFRGWYGLTGYSLTRAADGIVCQAGRLRRDAESTDARLGDLLLEARTLLACAAPILIDVAAEAAADGVPLALAEPLDVAIRPFRLPSLRGA